MCTETRGELLPASVDGRETLSATDVTVLINVPGSSSAQRQQYQHSVISGRRDELLEGVVGFGGAPHKGEWHTTHRQRERHRQQCVAHVSLSDR